MTNDFLTLAEISERSGVEIRTLRSWMAQGVIPGAETVGRNARYPQSALTRALAARAMREIYGMPLSEIRQDLLTADEARIEAYAAMAGAEGSENLNTAPTTVAGAAGPPSGTSAADYLRSLRSAGVFGASAVRSAAAPPPILRTKQQGGAAQSSPPFPPPASGSHLAGLAEALERIAGARPSRRKTRGDVRIHIPITPDLELTVRGDHSSEEIARFERIADLLRTILTGGPERD
jgi:DNA-binding transcriptional MerR regulator